MTGPHPLPILLMVRALGPGGTERQMTELARSLDRSRFEVHAGCFHEEFRADELRASGVPVVRFPVTSFLKPNVLRGAWLMGRYLRRHRIQLVHTFDYPMNCFGVPVARAFRVPVVLSSQRAHRQLTPPLYLKLLRLTDRLVNGIIVNSSSVRAEMIHREHVPERNLHLCHNGIDTSQFHSRDRIRLPALANAELVIGVVCVLRPEKGLPTLLNAFAQAASHRPRVRLAIVGSGPELDSLKSLAHDLHIESQCLFHPTVTNVADWLRSIDIFVLPSLSEALSNSLMEAMACGCCCIASRIGGNPELIHDGENGLLFESADSTGLARRIAELLDNPTLRAHLAGAATESIHRHFSLTASVHHMQHIYEGLYAQVQQRKTR